MNTAPLQAVISGIMDTPVAFLPMLDQIPVAMVILDQQRRVVALNQAAEVLTGFALERAQGLACRHVLRSDICVRGCPFANPADSTFPIHCEGDIINADRVRIPVRITASQLQGTDGRTAGFIETIEDLRLFENLEPKEAGVLGYAGILGCSPKMESLFKLLPSVAQTDSSVLITGETGTGKDMLAEALHQASSRAKGPFVKVNCGALPETLLESELFGHVKGAFTGAVENKSGRFKLAHNGTLFLTEIGDLPLALQVKLLSFLDDKTVYPLGATKPVKVDVRVIAATHRNLEQMVLDRQFREDLLFRLNVVRMHLPPLRERLNDTDLLIEHFLDVFNHAFQKKISTYDKRTRRLLQQYAYPGNVRELRNIVEYAVNVCNSEVINLRHLPAYITKQGPPRTAAPTAAPAREALTQPGYAPPAANWQSAERDLIMNALVQAKGRRGHAAQILGWSRSTLWRKMKKHALDDNPAGGSQ